MRRLVMWDIDYTLLRGGGVAAAAWKAAFTEVTGVAWRDTPIFGGRTDRDICAEVFEVHGVTDCTPERFFARYVEVVQTVRHQFAEQGELMPGVRAVLTRLSGDPGVVQTLVTGNVPEVAAAKVAAFGLEGSFDAEVGGYGTDDSVRATLVRRSLDRARAKYGEPFQPVVIGDTVYDVIAALANDAVAIGVATGATSADDLAAAGAHVVLPDLSDADAAVRALTAYSERA
ncbi:HAD family hydrolase [Actinoplanes sp. NPDC051851]|uniref:HAD family hydrolase n=1 Tax=Actinoplanes sp. NPDC051851 TaxID=3154753 RepID=UPI0034217360